MGRVKENKFVEEFETVIFKAGETFYDMGFFLPAQTFLCLIVNIEKNLFFIN
jgi:hypothetical protein